jgi:nicotinate-nucleotide pyrophosphorylase (carboxylating)
MAEEKLIDEQIDKIVSLALDEDTGQGDVTSEILIPPALTGRGIILVKAEGVLAGVSVAERIFRKVDPLLEFETVIKDGAKVKRGDIVATVSGRVISILKAERVALNFLQRLSGVATQTAQYVGKVSGTGVDIADTRKTTPGMRLLEKYAVRMGGGRNHRLHLGDGILIKDNHLAVLRSLGMSLKEIVAKARQNAPPGLKVEVEVNRIEEAMEVAEAGADIVMLDNMKPEEMRRAVKLLSGNVEIEASGGINLDTVRAVAETGIDFISVGALTHSSKALDISLELDAKSFKMS